MPLSKLRVLAQSQATRIFTDREHYKQAFDHWFDRHVDGVDQLKVLVYYGVGGIGKSRLMQELIRRAGTRDKSVRIIKLDFDSDEIDSAVLGLAAFRRQWGGACPLFDFALGRFLQMSGRSLESMRKHVLPEDGLLYELTDFACTIASTGFFSFGLIKELWKKEEAMRQRYGSLKDDFRLLEELSLADLALRLPLLLGDAVRHDAAKRADRKRLLVCVDGHERLLTEGYKLGKLHGDEWLKELIACSESGLYVICGRNRITWEQNDAEWALFVDQHLLGALDDRDADTFLAGIPIDDSGLRQTIIRTAKGIPLFLDLCASIYMAKSGAGVGLQPSDFEGAHKDVIRRFLDCLDRDHAQAVRALSVVESFDRAVFAEVTGALHIHIPIPTYDDFCAASYATEADRDTGVRAIHRVVRECLRTQVAPADLHAIVQAVLNEAEKSAMAGDALRAGRVLGSVAASAARLDEATGPAPWRRIVMGAMELADAGFPAEAERVASALRAGSPVPCLGAYRKLIKAHCLRRTGELDAAQALYVSVRQNPVPEMDAEVALLARFEHAHVDHLLGDYASAQREYEGIVAEEETAADANRPVSLARRQLGDIALISGRFTDALRQFHDCERRQGTHVLWQLECRRFVGHVYRFNWMPDKAKDIYLAIARQSSAAKLRGMHAKSLVNLAETCWCTAPEEALEWAGEAVRLNQDAGNLIEVGKAWTAAALAKLVRRDYDSAEHDLDRADALHVKTGYRSGLAFVHVARCFLAFAMEDMQSVAACRQILQKTIREIGVYGFLDVICAEVCRERDEPAVGLETFQWIDRVRLRTTLSEVRGRLRPSEITV